MASASVYYKFRSQKEFSRITFDGTGISVWDLKREIILQNKMGRGTDFDLKLFNADTGQEYTDDNAIVSRSSQVTAQRAPPSRPNEGTAQKYVAAHFAGLAGAAGLGDNGPGSRFSHNANAAGVAGASSSSGQAPGMANDPKRMGAMSRRFDGKAAAPSATPAGPDASAVDAPTGDEASSIAAMFAASNAEWDQAQQGMSTATYIGRGGIARRGGRGGFGGGRGGGSFTPSERRPPPSHGAHKPPGPGYICYRCGQKGHWIQDCPTNDDRDFDNRPRLKRTTGIPRSMLKTVEQPPEGALTSGGIMITPEGSYVIAQTDTAAWQRTQALAKPLSENDVYAQVPSDSSLACPLCAKLLRNAVKTPCCGTLYCEECIQTHLLEHDFQCAECERRIPDLADLKRDEETIRRVRKYVEDVMMRHERGETGAEGAEVKAEDGQSDGNVKKEADDTSAGTATKDATAVKSEVMQREASSTGATENKVATPSSRSTPLPKHKLPAKPTVNGLENLPPSSNAGSPRATLSNVGTGTNNGPNKNSAQQVNPAFMLPQMMMMLQNPHLPPQVRMQLQMNIQMIQSQIAAAAGVGVGPGPPGGGGGWGGGGQGPQFGMGMGMNPGMGMGMGIGMGHGMPPRPMNNFQPFQQQQQQQGGWGPGINHGGNNGGAAGAGARKRDRGQAELVEVLGGGGGGGTNADTSFSSAQDGDTSSGNVGGGYEGPAAKVARTS